MKPIDMVLYCPNCGHQHVDKPEGQFYPGHTAEESYHVNVVHGLWTNPPHRSHLCHACGTIWRPADVPTNGVAEVETRGRADTWVVHPEEVVAQAAVPKHDEDLLRRALVALIYHQEQTRPIHGTQLMIRILRTRLMP